MLFLSATSIRVFQLLEKVVRVQPFLLYFVQPGSHINYVGDGGLRKSEHQGQLLLAEVVLSVHLAVDVEQLRQPEIVQRALLSVPSCAGMSAGLQPSDFVGHCHIVGSSEKGKSTFLANLIVSLSDPRVQEKFPCSVIVADPHGDPTFDVVIGAKDWSRLRILDAAYTRLAVNPLQPFSEPRNGPCLRRHSL